ncbi:SprT-like domain-containing protein [Actinoplanes sp. TRM 88003]|uniref:SprT-like domain-containing protein n=1 Tax=Paractinoplanes aksuensis TaxID=2939490 RepID=A0ABT1DHS4_9ACTN|nr:SprT-like domain-containing protein [Actinoplanes aksuensis]MCO8270391.1 SprT-like domain-containing protein [Actinoplanes aksuensis]
MNEADARKLATDLMARHGLTGWRLVFDNARTRAGVCRFDRRQIGLSRVLTALHSQEQVTDTILHEIAHALTGPGHGHDRAWRATARRLGCSPTRSIPADAPRAEGAWVGSCPAGHRVTAHRRPIRVRSCPTCSKGFDLSARYTWTRDGRPAPMHPRYESELARLLAQPPKAAVTATPVRVGERVRLTGPGKYHGLTGTVLKRGRTRYQVQTTAGLLSAPFHAVQPLLAD